MEKDWPTLIVGGLFFLLGAIFCGVAAWLFFGERLEAARFQADGGTTRGEVLGKLIVADRTQGSLVRPKHRIEYRYTPSRAEPVTAQADIEAALWQRLGKGDSIEVSYLAADPSRHRVEGVASDLLLGLVFGLVGAFFAPIGFWLARNGLRGKRGEEPQRAIRWINANPPLALGSIGLLFFLPFAAGGAWWAKMATDESAEFATRARTVEGMVISKAVVRKSSGTSSSGSRTSHSTHYHATYRYLAEGAEVLGTTSLDSGDWDRLKERGPIAIVYVGGTPWKHRVGDEGGGWIGPAIFLGIGATGMLGSGYAAWRGWRRRGAPRAPLSTPAPPPRPAPEAQTSPAAPGRRGGNWILAAVGAIFFCAGSALAISGVLDLLEERRFGAEGQVAEARIVEKAIEEAERSGRRSTAYRVTYRFATRQGAAVEGRALLKPEAWEKANPGDSLRVQYLPARPESSRLQGESRMVDAIVGMAVGPLFALIGAALLLGAWMAWRDSRG